VSPPLFRDERHGAAAPDRGAPAPGPGAASEAARAEREAASRRWTDLAARTTAVLAVLAAIASGQYAESFSRTILAQTEASDAWSYYQAKSIKKYLAQGQQELAVALSDGRPAAGGRLGDLGRDAAERVKRYDEELADIKAKADALEARKRRHERRGARFQGAFIALQAGVVLSTVAASSRRKELWVGALLCGVAGLVLAIDAYFLLH
jgi:Domain of unknown function (DUF4337)